MLLAFRWRWRWALAVLATMLLAACGIVPLGSPPEEAPLFRRIDARVGVVYTTAARTANLTHPLVRLEVGKASVARFQQVFAAMFAEAVELPDWPPWREADAGVNGVIELERIDADLVVGNDVGGSTKVGLAAEGRPDVVSIAYRVCLYEPDGTGIRCWSPLASNSHQRSAGECLDLRVCIVRQSDGVIREAIARFMVEADRDPVLRAWSARFPQRGPAP